MSGPHELLARAAQWLWPALADHLWQSALFAALVFAAALLARRAPARVRHALWLVALLKFALPPALFAPLAARAGLDASWLFGSQTTPERAALVRQFAEPVSMLSDSLEITVFAEAPHREIYCALTLAWLAGCAALLVVRLKRRRELLRALGAGREVFTGREFDALERARRRLGLAVDVRLLLSPYRTEPGVWRTRAPLVVLPEAISAQLDEEELEALMLHELAHVERRDQLVSGIRTALTCVFWFCPPVWLVSRRLVEERERACDERVLEAGGAAGAYASSILKVVRFCTGWRVAGVSGAAAGPNLRRRIENIMFGETSLKQTAWQRALPFGAAAVALALSVGAGIYSHGQSVGNGGRDIPPKARATVAAQGGARARAVPRRDLEGAASDVIAQTPETVVRFENAGDAPLVITEAKMRLITREQLRRADEEGADYFDDEEKSETFLTMPNVTVSNFSGRTVKEVGIGFVVNGKAEVFTGHRAAIKPGESQTFRSEWNRRNVILPGPLADVRVQIVFAEFTDGTQWGARTRPPLPPAPPPPGGFGAARGSAPTAGHEPKGHTPTGLAPVGAAPAGEPPDGHGPAGAKVIRREGAGEGVGEGSGVGHGRGAGGRTVKGGNVRQRIVSAPNPVYPETAKEARARGTVAVSVVVDEDGNVISAEAVSGHPLLRPAAEEAARHAKFAPTRLNGQPVKVSGHITYNFVLAEKDEQK